MMNAPTTSNPQISTLLPFRLRKEAPALPRARVDSVKEILSSDILALPRHPPLEHGKDQQHQVEHHADRARVAHLALLESYLVDVLDEYRRRRPGASAGHHVDQVEDVQRIDDVEDQEEER